MKTRRIAFGLIGISLLACNFVTQMIVPPTATPQPTATATATASPTPSPTPLLPAFIPPQCANTPLATVPPDSVLARPTSESEDNPDISKREQLQILDEISEIVEHVYVYPDYNGKDWDAIVSRYRSMIEAGLDSRSFYLEMFNMITELEDEHSSYLSPAEVELTEAELRGEVEFVGVGIYGQPDVDRGRMIVISTFPGSPAEYAGIEPHDSILLVDGLPVLEDESNRLRGPECSTAIVRVQFPGKEPRDVMLLRSSIEGGLSIDARLVPTTDGSKIGYIFIPTFFDETIPQQIEKALDEFGGLDGLILDLRLNGGGSSTAVDPIIAYFVSGRLGQFVSREQSRPWDVEPDPIQNSQTVPLVIVVSEDTVSYGEIFAGVLKDTGRAKIVGETSLGNVEVLHGYGFDDGSVLWIASETFDSAFSDLNWEETGIIPDLNAFAEWDTITFETDPSIAAAVELLGHK